MKLEHFISSAGRAKLNVVADSYSDCMCNRNIQTDTILKYSMSFNDSQ